jgi:hypothetical protein
VSSDEPWWSVKPPTDAANTDAHADFGYQRREEADSLADAAGDLRNAADALRDAATPSAPPRESNWDFTWFTGWVKHSPNGVAFKHALWSVGPAWTLFLALQQFEFWTATGMTGIGFAIVGWWHLRSGRKVTRLLTWGLPLGLVYYAPVAIVFGLGQVLVGG